MDQAFIVSRRGRRFSTRAFVTRATLAMLALASSLVSARAQSITEFDVPSGGQPLSISPGPGGMWFTESESRLGRIDASGHVTEFPIPRPANRIVAGPDGNLWFTSEEHLSRMTPAGEVTEFGASGRMFGVTVGPDGHIWFTNSVSIGRSTVSGEITEVPFEIDGSVDLAFGADGNLWIPNPGDFAGHPAVVRFSPSSGDRESFAGPAAGGIVAGPDGNIWLTSFGPNSAVLRVTPSGAMTAFDLPGAAAGIAAGPDGRLWFTARTASRIGAMTTSGDVEFFALPHPSSFPESIAAGADGNIWFTEGEVSRIGRVQLLEPSVGDPLVLGDGRFQVRAAFRTPRAAGTGHPVSMTSNTGYFWFLDPDNVEVVVKVLNGCSVTGHSWVFVGGLTNVAVSLLVTDTVSGTEKSYASPQGTAYPPIQDTAAFPCLASGIGGKPGS